MTQLSPHSVSSTGKEILLASYVSNIFQWLAAQGVDTQTLLKERGFSLEELDNGAGWVSLQQCLAMLNLARDAGWQRDMTIPMGESLDLGSHGFLGYAVKASATLEQALALAVRYFRTRTSLFRICLFEEADQAVIQFDENVPMGDLFPWLMDTLLASIFRSSQQLFGARPPASSEVWVSYPEAPHHQALRAQSDGQIFFDAGSTQIRIPKSWLEIRLGSADPALMKLATEQCEKILNELQHPVSLTDRVRELARQHLTEDKPLDAVAARLHMAPRTLRRKLQAQGTSFQSLVEQLRKKTALDKLAHTTLPIEHIAAELGYTDPSNFGRAFRRWTGQSPRSWRQAHQRTS